MWTKKWTTTEDSATLEARKTVELDETRGVIQTRINQGQYSLTLPEQQYLKHIEGTATDQKSMRAQVPQELQETALSAMLNISHAIQLLGNIIKMVPGMILAEQPFITARKAHISFRRRCFS